jgi:hypothetical protein
MLQEFGDVSIAVGRGTGLETPSLCQCPNPASLYTT